MNISDRPYDPLTPAAYHALVVLYDLNCHAYLIADRIGRDTQGAVIISQATLGRLLARLVEEGLITRCEHDGRRQNYAITGPGREAVTREMTRLERAHILGMTAKRRHERQRP